MGNKGSNQNSAAGNRLMIMGLDAAGKTTMLWKLKLGEVTLRRETIGYSIETVTYKKIEFLIIDVGGREKWRPLYEQYYDGTQGLIFVVDSNDKQRMNKARQELHTILQHEDMEDVVVLIMANKQDLPNALSPEEVEYALDMVYYSQVSPNVLKSIANETLIKTLPDSIVYIISSYTKEKECRPMNCKHVHLGSIFSSDKEFPGTLFTREVLGEKYSDIIDLVNRTICEYLPPYESELGAQTKCKVIPTCSTTGDGLYEGLDWLSSTLTEMYSSKKKNCVVL